MHTGKILSSCQSEKMVLLWMELREGKIQLQKKIVPDNCKQENIKAILTKGDGNCLFNAASIALCGMEKLSAELQMWTRDEPITKIAD